MKNKYKSKIFEGDLTFFLLKTYVKRSQDQKANYEEEKKRLSANDLQIVDADQKAKRIENRIKKVCFHL
jgi:hypothetical protein